MRILSFFLLMLFLEISYGQETLYIPLEFQKAYKNKTRSHDGKPGENYWQNSSEYKIYAEVVSGDWKLMASQEITYYNNSPDTLKYIVIKTYANHYKKGSARSNKLPLETLTQGIQISNFKINGNPIDLSDASITETNSTFFTISLSKAVLPNTSVNLSMDWEVELPQTYVNRIGAYDEHSAFFGYWYPQVAVYDDIDGWDTNEYLGTQEFYTDLSSFDVEIKVPQEYKIWATGTPENYSTALNKENYEIYSQINTSRNVLNITGDNLKPQNSETFQIWKFSAKKVRDFSFGVSNNFNWLTQGLKNDDKIISSNVVFDPKFDDIALEIIKAQEASFDFLQEKLPGVPYPYGQFTTFIGVKDEFDGMEFSMMANNGTSDKEVENADVTFHELAHTYFPFLLGINEVKYSWMEEGWASFLTIKFIQDYFKGSPNENVELKRILKNYTDSAGQQWDVPLFAQTNQLTARKGHVLLSYKKPTFLYLALEELLGASLFKKCTQEYIKRWEGKKASPYDFMFSFNDISEQDLNWFWNAWIFEYGYMDVAITEFKNSKLSITNIGGLPVPLRIKLTYNDKSNKIIHQTPLIWKEKNTFEITIENTLGLQKIELLYDQFPDLNKSNNIFIVSTE